MVQRMRIGFIGGFGHHYLRGALNDPSLEIERPVGVAPSGPADDQARPLAQRFGEVRFFENPIALLDEYQPQVVSVGGVYADNGDVAAAALQREIAVVSDKPIAGTWAQLERLHQLLDGSRRVLLTEFDFHSRAEFRAARVAVRSGRIGMPVLATAQKSYRFGRRPAWYRDRALYTGTMLWIASHAIDAIAWTTGRRVLRITGRQGNVSKPEFGSMEDHCAAMMELEQGATGIAHADYLRPDGSKTHGDDRLRIAGSEGVIEVREGKCMLLGRDGNEMDVTRSIHPRPIHIELLDAIGGEDPELYSTAQSLEMAAVLLAARDAADQQRWIDVPGI
jgi:predicted dehydrogenase